MKIYSYLFVLLFMGGISSCEKWFNVSPLTNIRADELIKTEEGFHKALIGVYIDMTKSSLYGGDLTMSVLDVLAQNYTTPMSQAKHPYEKYAKYEYTDQKVELRLDNIWNGLYNCITGCNSIFESLDLQKNIFSPHYYEIVKGELLALRAMFHFDALRLYVQAPKYGLDVKAIPYVQYFGEKRVPFSTSKEALQYIIRDLKNARELLRNNDPIVPTNNVTTANNYLENRQIRMNYYAATAILARVYLWAENYTEAYNCAKEVVESNRFGLVSDKAVEDIIDEEMPLIFTQEQIMCLHVSQLHVNVTKYMFDKEDLGTVLAIDEITGDEIYKLGDIRYTTWFKGFVDGHNAIIKYKNGEFIPIVKISEMILILAEASENIEEAAVHLNFLRKNRGVGNAIISNFNITELLLDEYRREFIGEGVMFYQYKRFDKEILPNNTVLSDTKAVYNLPIPKAELEFAQ